MLRDLIAKLKIVFDKEAAAKAEAGVKTGWDRLELQAKKLGAAIAAAYAVKKVLDFGAAMVRVAVEAEVPWNRLAGTVERMGASFESVERRIKLAARALADTSTVGDEQFAATLDRLIGLSNDFEGSLRNVQLVADVAARFFNGELAPAADLVGRVMGGTLRGLKQLGIQATDSADGLRQLAERSRGAAQNELNTLEGRLKQTNEEFINLKENIGGGVLALLRMAAGTDDNTIAVNRLRLGLREVNDELERLAAAPAAKRSFMEKLGIVGGLLNPSTAVATWRRLAEERRERGEIAITQLQGPGGRVPPGKPKPETDDERNKRLDAEVAALKQGHELGTLRNADIMRALDLEERYVAALKAGNVSLEERNRLAQRIAGLQDIVTSGGTVGIAGGRIPTSLKLAPISRNLHVSQRRARTGTERDELDRQRKDHEEHWQAIAGAATNAAAGIGGSFQDMFDLILDGTATIGSAFEALARGMAGSILGGVAQVAAAESAMEVRKALGATAQGTTSLGNPLTALLASFSFAGAQQHWAAAAAWAALAGGAGAAASAVGGGGRGGQSGGIPSGARDADARRIKAEDRLAPQTVIYVNPWDSKDPVQVRENGKMMKASAASDSSIVVYLGRITKR